MNEQTSIQELLSVIDEYKDKVRALESVIVVQESAIKDLNDQLNFQRDYVKRLQGAIREAQDYE